jgi:hypothetical protein
MSASDQPKPVRRDLPPPIDNGVASSSPALAVFNGALYLAYQGCGSHIGELWYTTYKGLDWLNPIQIPGVRMSESPSLAVFNGKLYCAYQGPNNDGEVRYTTTSDGVNWAADTQIPYMGMSGSPSLAVFNGKLYLAHPGGVGSVPWYTATSDGVNWTLDTPLDQSEMFAMSGSPSLATFNGKLYCALTQGDSNKELWCTTTSDGVNWSTGTQIPHIGMSGSPALTVYEGKLYVWHQGEGENCEVWYTRTSDGVNWEADSFFGNDVIGSFLIVSGSPAVATVVNDPHVIGPAMFVAATAPDHTLNYYISENWEA